MVELVKELQTKSVLILKGNFNEASWPEVVNDMTNCANILIDVLKPKCDIYFAVAQNVAVTSV